MFVIPTKVNDREYDVLVVLDDDGIERIKRRDPAEIVSKKFPPEFRGLRMRNVGITYAEENEIEEILARVRSGDIAGVLRYLTRGFKFQPEKGDTDEPYQSVLKK